MVKFTEKDVIKYAKLARIRVEPDQLASYANDMSGIFSWIEQIQSINTDGIEPLITFGDQMPMQPDIVSDGHKQKEVLSNAPDSYMGFYAVPKVIE
ncbi:MAG: Asp-tRNA(Asn)/Glu-tRNA(Gln) amidotransferase subunit GatC [Alphaproteobacteria bacterium]|nr:MAG: Asp-tRNA(Asn)/Glu-tRNA(Gln) amidotransferase subunit GatC [Alphaproteobacteria bacterium]